MVKAPREAPRSAEAGYNMVVLMVAVTILTVLTAAALPMWSHAMKREKEEELIFRGWQYAEAIRVFQQRHGRLPTRLQELVEVKPRSIRKLWKDPMTESGEWGLVFQGAGATGLPGGGADAPGGVGGARGDGRDDEDDRDGRGRRRRGAPRPGEQVTVGPIVGVHSRSDEDAVKVLFGEESYNRWQFTVERLIGGAGARGQQVGGVPRELGGRGTAGQPPPIVPAKWLGRPFRPGLEVPQGGGLPGGGQGLDGRPRPGGPPGREVGAGRPDR